MTWRDRSRAHDIHSTMKLLLITSILLASVGCLFAAECHLCNYLPDAMDDDCGDPFTSSTTENSTQTCQGTYCMKVTSKFGGSLASIARSCSEACSDLCISLLGIEGCTYCCQGNLCNGVTPLTVSLSLVVATVTAALKLSV